MQSTKSHESHETREYDQNELWRKHLHAATRQIIALREENARLREEFAMMSGAYERLRDAVFSIQTGLHFQQDPYAYAYQQEYVQNAEELLETNHLGTNSPENQPRDADTKTICAEKSSEPIVLAPDGYKTCRCGQRFTKKNRKYCGKCRDQKKKDLQRAAKKDEKKKGVEAENPEQNADGEIIESAEGTIRSPSPDSDRDLYVRGESHRRPVRYSDITVK